MPIAVEPDGPTWRWIALCALGVVQFLFGLMIRSVRDALKEQGLKIGDLERTSVSRDELERHVERLEASGVRMHQDNQNTMHRIEEKLESGGHTRHDIRDGVGAIQLMLRKTLEELKQERAGNKS